MNNKLIAAYERMHERSIALLDKTTQELLPSVVEALESAKEQAIHLGGGTQLLFGIKGGRWNNDDNIKYNEHWISPMKEDYINDYKKHEDGSYW